MKWFGKDWGAPICRGTAHADTPVGALCGVCGRAIKDYDEGFLIPQEWCTVRGYEFDETAYHLDCFVAATVPHAARGKTPPVE